MKKEKIIMILLPIICLCMAIISYIGVVNINGDAIKFKKEYESLNGTKSNNKEYKKVEISKNNPIKYSNYDEIIDVIKNKTGIIYLGFPECPWCRNAVPVLLEAARDNNIDTIYYLNILNERDSYIVNDGKVEYAKDQDGNDIKGTPGYSKLLKVLDNELEDYIIEFEGKEYNTNVKRIYAPTVIFVRDGKVIGLHISTVSTQTDPYKDLTDKQYKELYDEYSDYISSMLSSSCPIDSAC